MGEGAEEPEFRGITRRQLLTRGVGAGVALIWAIPTVETLTQVSAAAGSLPPPPPPRCASDKDDPWPRWVHGRPDPLHYGSAKGVYLWNDGKWHLDVTQPIGDPHEVFSGTIMTAGRIFGVTPVSLQPNDHWKLSPDGHTLTF